MIAEQVRKIVADVFDIPPEKVSGSLDGLDSLHMIDLAFRLEKEFDIHIDEDELERFATFDQLLQLVAEKADCRSK